MYACMHTYIRTYIHTCRQEGKHKPTETESDGERKRDAHAHAHTRTKQRKPKPCLDPSIVRTEGPSVLGRWTTAEQRIKTAALPRKTKRHHFYNGAWNTVRIWKTHLAGLTILTLNPCKLGMYDIFHSISGMLNPDNPNFVTSTGRSPVFLLPSRLWGPNGRFRPGF